MLIFWEESSGSPGKAKSLHTYGSLEGSVISQQVDKSY